MSGMPAGFATPAADCVGRPAATRSARPRAGLPLHAPEGELAQLPTPTIATRALPNAAPPLGWSTVPVPVVGGCRPRDAGTVAAALVAHRSPRLRDAGRDPP